MTPLFINFMSFFITFPILATWIVFYISKKIHRHKWRAIHQAVNWTTLLYIFVSIILLKVIFEQYFIGPLLLLLLCMLTFIIVIQWKIKTEVLLVKAIKQLWRACFLLFLFLYLFLVLFGIVEMIIFD